MIRCVFGKTLPFAILLSLYSFSSAQDFELGKSIFASKCANCHGDRGQGDNERYPHALQGDLSVVELASVIQETMPEGEPKSLSIEDAKALSVFVHHEFYSQMAQLRNSPPVIELSHLTVDQFRESVVDLMLPFTGQAEQWKDERGLKRSIHQGDWKERKEVQTIVNSQLSFDWGDGKPVPEIDKEKWQIRWNGSLFAPVTGQYEFYLESTIRTTVFVNDDQVPLIDAAVVSFEKPQQNASVFLVGGHSYHFAIDAQHGKEPKSRLTLEWKVPNGLREPIPERLFAPTWSPMKLVCSTLFPPDDSSIGYERGRSVSHEWYEATISSAIEVGNKLTANLKRWMPNDGNDPNNRDLVKRWCHRWVSVALRHTLTDEEKTRYVDQHFENNEPIDRAVKKVAILAIASPDFQYPLLIESEDERIVSHLALALWDSVPEEWMLQAASRREVHTDDQIGSLAERMMDDLRFQKKLKGFFHEFLGVKALKELSKDSVRYPEFNERIASDLRTSFDLFINEFAKNPMVDCRQLLTADYLYVNGRLAKIYGFDLPEDAPFQRMTVPRDQRSGVLSHPYLMSGLAYHASSSPIHRGVFLVRRVLGRNLRPPVDAIIPIPEEAAPGMTTRERVAMQTGGAMCQSCHRVINPLGFTLEHYDALGRFRLEELGKAIDASGQYITVDGQPAAFKGVREMAEFLANSNEVHTSIVRQLFQYLIKQPLAAYDLNETSKLDESFAAEGFAIKPLVKKLVLLSSRRPNHPESINQVTSNN